MLLFVAHRDIVYYTDSVTAFIIAVVVMWMVTALSVPFGV